MVEGMVLRLARWRPDLIVQEEASDEAIVSERARLTTAMAGRAVGVGAKSSSSSPESSFRGHQRGSPALTLLQPVTGRNPTPASFFYSVL